MSNNNESINSTTRADISDVIYKEVGISFSDSMEILDLVLEEVSAAMEKGNDVKISSFGSFLLKDKKERLGRNPKTGVGAVIVPRKVISFRASNNFKDKVLAGNKSGS